MKGVVFAEFIELVEKKFGDETLDHIIESSNLQSGGAYTAGGTYDHGEILTLVTKLSESTRVPIVDLVKAFGGHLIKTFSKNHAVFFEGKNHSFDFLKTVHDIIHVEVKKLYPDAELPQFTYEEPDNNTLIMNYQSKRPFASLAEGLILGTIEYFGDKVELTTEPLSEDTERSRKFIMKRVSSE